MKKFIVGFIACTAIAACADTSSVEVQEPAAAPEPVVEEAVVQDVPEVAAVETTQSQGGSEIIVYRTQILGLAIQPAVFVNGQKGGVCTPREFFSVPVGAGTHALSARVLREKELTVSTNGTDKVYVKCSSTPGLVVGGIRLKQVSAAEGAADVAKLKRQ